MARPAVLFMTYMFANDSALTVNKTYGFSTPIYCGYIQKIYVDDINNKKINFYFPSVDDFQFMRTASDISISDGTGFNAKKLYGLYQIVDVDSAADSGDTVQVSSDWKIIDVTDQLPNYATWSGATIDKSDLLNSIIVVDEERINSADSFLLNDYLTLQTTGTTDNKLAFGEEQIFMGNVQCKIEADIYRSEVDVVLGEEYYNTSENPTWDSSQPVYISEVGIYDDDNNLVAIAKLNYPIDKSSLLSRTIIIDLDF